MRIDLTISASYVPDWGCVEGVREIFQNALDADKDGYVFGWEYDAAKQTLRVWNVGASLTSSSLLLGNSSKRDRADMIGQFGEGYKLGALALARCGKKLTIKNEIPGEIWTSEIRISKRLADRVLSFEIRKSKEQTSQPRRLEFVVENLGEDEWQICRKNFRFLTDEKIDTCYETPYGHILDGKDMSGKIYVNGIFVQRNAKFLYGYDFKPNFVEIDRDRKMVSQWTLESYAAKMWIAVALSSEESFVKVSNLMTKGIPDMTDMRYDFNVPLDLAKKFLERFKEDFGEDAYPVSSEEDYRKVEYLGRRPIMVSEGLTTLLRSSAKVGTLKDLEKQNAHAVKDGDIVLTSEESCNLATAMQVLQAEEVPPFNVSVVEFRDPKLMGLSDPAARRVMIARWCLTSAEQALQVLIHEYAHACGNDGEITHQHTVEDIWMRVWRRLWNKYNSMRCEMSGLASLRDTEKTELHQ